VDVVYCQEAKYIECWPNTTSAWAGWRRFNIPVDVVEYNACYSALFSPTYQQARQLKILIEQNIKICRGPAFS
jgi:hypothetical protein